MSHRATAYAAYIVGALSSGSAIIAAQGAMWIPAALCVLVGATFYEFGHRERTAARAARASSEATEAAARPPGPHTPTWAPCCDYWIHSAGMAHNPRECRRSSAA